MTVAFSKKPRRARVYRRGPTLPSSSWCGGAHGRRRRDEDCGGGGDGSGVLARRRCAQLRVRVQFEKFSDKVLQIEVVAGDDGGGGCLPDSNEKVQGVGEEDDGGSRDRGPGRWQPGGVGGHGPDRGARQCARHAGRRGWHAQRRVPRRRVGPRRQPQRLPRREAQRKELCEPSWKGLRLDL